MVHSDLMAASCTSTLRHWVCTRSKLTSTSSRGFGTAGITGDVSPSFVFAKQAKYLVLGKAITHLDAERLILALELTVSRVFQDESSKVS